MSISNLLNSHKTVIANISYVSILQVFILAAPLITYPYLVKVLGMELYGVILTAQMLASYATIIIDFGSNSVCAKHVSINRDNKEKLSEILSSVLCVRFILFVICFLFYMLIVMAIPLYRDYWLLFLLTYGLTINDLLFPQFFFQGLERMKQITIISIVTKLVFILLVFVVVKQRSDYLLVPIFYTAGYTIGGIIALYLIINKLNISLYIPPYKIMMNYIKDSSAIFATDLICTIKDKINYMLVGAFVGMNSVVIYDLALKINGLVSRPLSIINTVMFPRLAKSQNLKTLKTVLFFSFIFVVFLVIVVNIFLPHISTFFLHEEVEVLPIRLLLFAPIILSISLCLAQNFLVAFGYNKYVFYSILVTTGVYLLLLISFYFLGILHSIYTFIYMALISYIVELVYRIRIVRLLIARIRYMC